jgi:hypothetical protein
MILFWIPFIRTPYICHGISKLRVIEAILNNAISFSHLYCWVCDPDFVFSLGCAVCSFCVGCFVVSVPGYNADWLVFILCTKSFVFYSQVSKP